MLAVDTVYYSPYCVMTIHSLSFQTQCHSAIALAIAIGQSVCIIYTFKVTTFLVNNYITIYFSPCTVIDCGHLKAPKNGEVHFKSTAYAAKAYYQCNKGYTRHGTEVRFCQANGEWSGTAPTCNG